MLFFSAIDTSKTSPKRRLIWWRIWVAIGVILSVVLALILINEYTTWFNREPVEAGVENTTTTTVATTTTGTTLPPTTTVAPTTTTTNTTPTTTTTEPEITYNPFSWSYRKVYQGEVLLREEFTPREGVTQEVSLVSVVFLLDEVYEDPVFGTVLPTYYGDDPVSGEKIVLNHRLGDSPGCPVEFESSPNGRWIPIDPGAPLDQQHTCDREVTIDEFLQMLRPDQVYPIEVLSSLTYDTYTCPSGLTAEACEAYREGVDRAVGAVNLALRALEGKETWVPTDDLMLSVGYFLVDQITEGGVEPSCP